MTPDPNPAESCAQGTAPLTGRKTGTMPEPELVTATRQELASIATAIAVGALCVKLTSTSRTGPADRDDD